MDVKLVLCVVNSFISINLLLFALWMVISIVEIVLVFVKTHVSVNYYFIFFVHCINDEVSECRD